MYLNHAEKLPRTLIFGEEGKFTIEFEIAENHPFLHFNVQNITPSTYKNLEYAFVNLKAFLGACGYPKLYGVVPKDRDSLHKLYKRMGLTPLTEFNDNIIYEISVDEPEDFSDVELTPEEEQQAKEQEKELFEKAEKGL